MKKTVKAIFVYFPQRDDGLEVHYEIGIDNVTDIVPAWVNGRFCYQIYKNHKFDSELYDYSHILYFEE